MRGQSKRYLIYSERVPLIHLLFFEAMNSFFIPWIQDIFAILPPYPVPEPVWENVTYLLHYLMLRPKREWREHYALNLLR